VPQTREEDTEDAISLRNVNRKDLCELVCAVAREANADVIALVESNIDQNLMLE